MAPQAHRLTLPKTGTKRRVQPVSRHRVKVVLTKEARTLLRASRREKSDRFQAALDSAWRKVDELTRTLASTHHKSLCRVQNELHIGLGHHLSRHKKINPWNAYCWKKRDQGTSESRIRVNADKENGAPRDFSILPAFVKKNLPEYHALTAEEKENLVKEYSEYIADKKVGIRMTTHGKITDATQTLKCIEEELLNLRARTGVEVILYATRGSTDLPLRAFTFETEGVKDFIGSVINMDTHDLVSKMEGFAVQGVQGAASNHQQRISNIRGAIRKLINEKLEAITGEPKAKMQWKAYFRNIVSRYRVAIEGWPPTVPFANLSEASSSLPQLEMLQRKWEMNLTYWKKLTNEPEEFNALKQERDDKIENGEIVDPTRRTCSDKGTKRSHTGSDSSRPSKKAKSTPIVHEEDSTQDSAEPAPPAAETSTSTTSSANSDKAAAGNTIMEGGDVGNAATSSESAGEEQGNGNEARSGNEVIEGRSGEDLMTELADIIDGFDTTAGSLY